MGEEQVNREVTRSLRHACALGYSEGWTAMYPHTIGASALFAAVQAYPSH